MRNALTELSKIKPVEWGSTDDKGVPLFVDDEELRRRINPKIGRDRFRSALRTLEAKYPDFPKIHALFRGRYWPAVKAWLDGKNGVRENERIAPSQDGPETFDAPS
jgi:hypothetical protein